MLEKILKKERSCKFLLFAIKIPNLDSSSGIWSAGNGSARCLTAQKEFRQIFPQLGWVEHDPTAIISSQLEVARQVIKKAGVKAASLLALVWLISGKQFSSESEKLASLCVIPLLFSVALMSRSALWMWGKLRPFFLWAIIYCCKMK